LSMSGQEQNVGKETLEQALSRAQSAAQAKRFGEAAGICDDVLRASPDHPGALALLGVIAAQTSHPERAIEFLERAVKRHPGVPAWYANLCSLYRTLNRMPQALTAGQEAVRLAPNNPDNLVNLSLVFTDLDDRDRAVACLLRALGLNPAHADGRLALAQNLLARGELEPGWIEYEWRNETEAGKGQLPRITSAPWNGMSIPNGKLLLIGDQGYGDTIQFARYIPLAAHRCQEVILGCSAEMAPLMSRIPGVVRCCHRWNEIPAHAAHARLSSLAGLFHTRLETIPAKVPYLSPNPGLCTQWAERLRQTLPPKMPRIGLAWSGRPTHPNDRRRSIRLSQLLPLASTGSAIFVCLQKPFPTSDLEARSLFPGLIDLSADLPDFDATAALVANLDLVITVDTAIGHLSGALAKPVWILLAKASDWRWLLDRSDSPWYPTARLFRQPAPGSWEPVIAEAASALTAWLETSGRKVAAELSHD
jgi:Tfp pilus assembly protein PilF